MAVIEPRGSLQYRIRNDWGLMLRLIGLPFAGFGFYVGVVPTIANLYGWLSGALTTRILLECIPGMLVGIVIGLPILFVGWVMAFLRHYIDIDQRHQQVTVTRDALIWQFTRSFPFSDVKQIGFKTTANRTNRQTRYYANAIIVTETGEFPVATLPSRQEDEVKNIANELANLIGVPMKAGKQSSD